MCRLHMCVWVLIAYLSPERLIIPTKIDRDSERERGRARHSKEQTIDGQRQTERERRDREREMRETEREAQRSGETDR